MEPADEHRPWAVVADAIERPPHGPNWMVGEQLSGALGR